MANHLCQTSDVHFLLTRVKLSEINRTHYKVVLPHFVQRRENITSRLIECRSPSKVNLASDGS